MSSASTQQVFCPSCSERRPLGTRVREGLQVGYTIHKKIVALPAEIKCPVCGMWTVVERESWQYQSAAAPAQASAETDNSLRPPLPAGEA